MTTTGDQPDAPEQSAAVRPVSELPDAVRHRVIEWAAEALSVLTPTEIPPALTRVARFAPHKRARVAAAALGLAVQNDAAFRALVAQRAAAQVSGIAAPGSEQDLSNDVAAVSAVNGTVGPDDPVLAAARAYLLRLPEQDELIRAAAAAAAAAQQQDAQARVIELEGDVRLLRSELARSQAELHRLRVDQPQGAAEAAVDRLRRRLRDQGSRIRELQLQVDGAAAGTAHDLAAVTDERDRALADADQWRQRAEAATARAEAAAVSLRSLRESAGDRRAASDRRLELLLGALEGAALGLRREWDLIGGGPAPADVVAGRMPAPPSDAERTVDPARLAAWLGLPAAHLIVDGYNVTKTGFPGLSLSDQRDRLVRSLSALAARTSAEVTVVFDGAAVATARPPARGIRVLFSPPGVTADHVIRDLVRGEPAGRVLVVVSSDRQVADTAVRDGARTAGSPALLAVIGS